MSYRLATTDTEAPGARVASTIRCFRSAVHLRRSERPIAHHRASTWCPPIPLADTIMPRREPLPASGATNGRPRPEPEMATPAVRVSAQSTPSRRRSTDAPN
jgi:hypothetical protein